MKRLIWTGMSVSSLAALAVGVVAAWFLLSPASASDAKVVVKVPRGAAASQVARRLAEAGVVRHGRGFQLYARATGRASHVQAGEYRFARNLTPRDVLDKLVRGDTIKYRVTIPEGYTAEQASRIIEKAGLAEAEDVLALANDAEFTGSLDVPADGLEGYLFPETYAFDKMAGARRILQTMVRRWHDVFTPELEARARELEMTVHEVMILASIIEKETGVASERAVISGVFHNRMAKGMRLETDPTVIYGIEDYDGDIRFRDLRDRSNPYNTYVHDGLPPGPIANPGEAAIRAALWPEDHDYLFFVARDDGSHVFSQTFAEHTRWVRKYQMN